MLPWQETFFFFFLAVVFQKPEMRGSSECQSRRRTGNKNRLWEWTSGNTPWPCELSLTLAPELPPPSAQSQSMSAVLSLCIRAWEAVRRQGRVSRWLESEGLLGTPHNFPTSGGAGYPYSTACLPRARHDYARIYIKI